MIYCVEDDTDIRELIVYTLESAGYRAEGIGDGASLRTAMEKTLPELILMDIMLPGEDGVSLLQWIRSRNETAGIPVIMLTARGSEFDKVRSLDLGADDYVTKPFGMMELLSRIRAVLRRSGRGVRTTVLQAGPVLMDLDRHSVKSSGQDVTLTLKEYDLLRKLMENLNVVFSRDQLLEDVWGYDIGGETRTVDVHVRNLRQKLGEPGEMIETVRGVGYRMRDVLKNE
ncbi:MAG: response regulator transcription factor [Lachnospiraceae bacterium]|nr:response regulator transcription factor [Lachnospiraceae bacterium]